MPFGRNIDYPVYYSIHLKLVVKSKYNKITINIQTIFEFWDKTCFSSRLFKNTVNQNFDDKLLLDNLLQTLSAFNDVLLYVHIGIIPSPNTNWSQVCVSTVSPAIHLIKKFIENLYFQFFILLKFYGVYSIF